MKKYIAILPLFVLFLITGKALAQDSNQLSDMISDCIEKSLKEKEEKISRLPQFPSEVDNSIYILEDYFPFNYNLTTLKDRLELAIRNKQVYFLNKYENQTTKQLKQGVPTLCFDGIRISSSRVHILLSYRIATAKKKNQLNLTFSTYEKYVYQYSCENDEWKLIDTITN